MTKSTGTRHLSCLVVVFDRRLGRRHLIRLWLRNDELAWKTPEVLAPIWKRLYSVPPEEQRFPIEPEIRRKENGATK